MRTAPVRSTSSRRSTSTRCVPRLLQSGVLAHRRHGLGKFALVGGDPGARSFLKGIQEHGEGAEVRDGV